MNIKLLKAARLSGLILAGAFLVIPPIFYSSNPNPDVGLIGCCGIHIKGVMKEGYPLYIFWIDFVVFAVFSLLAAFIAHLKCNSTVTDSR